MSQVSKVMETIIRDETVGLYLQNHNMIKASQHGFWKRRPCLTKLLVYLDRVTSKYDPISMKGCWWVSFVSNSICNVY